MEKSTVDYERALRVLVVDDVQVHRFLMVTGLQRINPFATVEEALSVEAAIEKLAAGNFNIVVSDWNMPGGGGEAIIRWMRSRPHFRRVPFVMISSNQDNEDIIKAFMDIGVDAYVVKPFDAKVLYGKMIAALDKRAA